MPAGGSFGSGGGRTVTVTWPWVSMIVGSGWSQVVAARTVNDALLGGTQHHEPLGRETGAEITERTGEAERSAPVQSSGRDTT